MDRDAAGRGLVEASQMKAVGLQWLYRVFAVVFVT
jgi:hypothetical protein